MKHELDAYRKQCADICAAVPKNPTNLKLVFDLETTGLNPAEDEILEAAIVTTDGDILFESRFKPARNRMAESTKCQRYLTGNGSRCTGDHRQNRRNGGAAAKRRNNYRLQRQALRYSVSRVLRYSIPTGCHGFRPHA